MTRSGRLGRSVPRGSASAEVEPPTKETVAIPGKSGNGAPAHVEDPEFTIVSETFELIEWTFQTTLPEFIDENVHSMEDAIVLGRKFVELEEDVWKAIGYLALHVEKAEGGRGYKGGVSEFARGIGRPRETIKSWMVAVRGKNKLGDFHQVIPELPQAHYREIDRADDPEPVIEIIAETYEGTGKIPPLAEVKRAVHVSFNSGNSEWYTPPEYIEAARELMGDIEVDPASTPRANEIVRAETYYTAEDDGLTKEWRGKVWMNPPYSQPHVAEFCDLFVEKFTAGEITEGCVFVNNATETAFMQNMLRACSAALFVKGRVAFLDPDGNPGNPLQGQTLLYFGENTERFGQLFKDFGVVLYA